MVDTPSEFHGGGGVHEELSACPGCGGPRRRVNDLAITRRLAYHDLISAVPDGAGAEPFWRVPVRRSETAGGGGRRSAVGPVVACGRCGAVLADRVLVEAGAGMRVASVAQTVRLAQVNSEVAAPPCMA